MLVLRNSNAVPSTRGPFDPFPESFFDDIYLWASQGKFDKILIDVDSTKQYDEDMKVLGSIEKSLVRRLRKDLNNGYIVTNSVPRDNTHYLKDHSKPSKFLRFTKDLTSTMDRFDYNIYKPTLDAASRTVTIRIVIQSLLDHNIPGQGTYSDTEE